MSTLSNQAEILREVLIGGKRIPKEVWEQEHLDLQVLERVYVLIKPRLDYLRGYSSTKITTYSGSEAHQIIDVVNIAVLRGENVSLPEIKIRLTRKGTWVVSRQGTVDAQFTNLLALTTCVSAMVADVSDLQLHVWKRDGGWGSRSESIPLLLAEQLLKMFEESVEAKRKDLEAEQRVIVQAETLMSHFIH